MAIGIKLKGLRFRCLVYSGHQVATNSRVVYFY